MTAPSDHRLPRSIVRVQAGSWSFCFPKMNGGLDTRGVLVEPASARGGVPFRDLFRSLNATGRVLFRTLNAAQGQARGTAKLLKSFRRSLLHEPINGESDVGSIRFEAGDFRNVMR